MKSSGVEVTDPLQISNLLNEYFCSVGPNLVKKLPVLTSTCTDCIDKQVLNSIHVEPITSVELCNVIYSLNIKKSCGPDGIGPRLVKDNMYLLCEPLTYIYNLSLMNGIVPDKLKIAKIIPLFKKGDEHLACNYRPISLLSIFDKILEMLVYRRISNFFKKHNVLYKHQFGFRNNYSTTLALLDVVDTCYKNLDQYNKIIGIYFDLQKAFDTVDHNILLHKLYAYGIRGVMYDWVKNYLTDRKQFTFVNNVSSDVGIVSCGVPQGSVLGPLLFLIYVNDISNAVPNDKLKLFADDTNLFVYGSSLSNIEVDANHYLKQMELLFIKNKLSLNIKKTSYTVFDSRCKLSTDSSLNLFINGQKIAKVSSSKYLGVIIGCSLRWSEHVDYVYKKLVKFTSIFYKLRNYLPQQCLKKLYYAFIYPHISYGLEVYGNTTTSQIDKLFKLNNKILRILLNKPLCTPVVDLYTEMNTLPIPTLHEMLMLMFVHKYVHHRHLLPEVFHDYFAENNSIHDYNTRERSGLHIFSVRTSFGQRCTLYRASKFWNDLPQYLKSMSSIASFKKNLKSFLIHRLCT